MQRNNNISRLAHLFERSRIPVLKFPIYCSKKDELKSILDDLVCKYQETPLSILECFYFPGDAEEVENYGQALMDWTSDIRKHLIQLKAETTKMLRDKEKDSEIPKDWLLSEFLTYEQRLKHIYHSVVKFEYWLKIKYKPARQDLVLSESSSSAVQVIPDHTGRIPCPKPNDGVALTERLDKVSIKRLSIKVLSSSICFPEIRHSIILDPQLPHRIPNLPSRIFSTSLRNP